MADIFDYSGKTAAGYPGMIAETQFKDAASRRVETAPVAFGLAVGKGGKDGTVKLGGTGFVGIAVADLSMGDGYKVGDVGAFLRKGTIWVTASNAVAAGDPVTFTPATGVIGKGLTGVIADAVFETTGAQGDLVRIYLG
ncbi:hypothetical protein ACEYYB_11390 [Paracoccus sp. p4-l81]|uniref:structural cement protein Gp24 n=1 Tax=Paracoccus sp. p4-l81 TaxID=3342806 RepID=UPI0035B71EAD